MQLPRPLSPIARNPLVQGAVLFLLATALFIPAMTGDFIWDDDITITNNALVKLPFNEGLRNIWFSTLPTDYYPVTWSTFWIEWRFFAGNPSGYHVVNILLHALSSVLLWRILLRLRLPGGAATAWCAALLFAAHPLAVDSVAWISQRKNTLSMVFYLASILGYLRFTDSGTRRFYWLSVLAFAAALLSKSSIIALPAVLICVLWYRQGTPYLSSLLDGILPAKTKKKGKAHPRRSLFKHELVRLIPFFLLAAGSVYLTLWFQGKVLGYGLATGNDPNQTISRAIEISLHGKIPVGERLLVLGQTYWLYLGKLFFPKDVAMVYANWKVNPGHFAQYLPSIFMVGAILAAFLLHRRIGRGLCAGLAAIAVSLLPVLGLVKMSYQAYSWVANHLCYVAVPVAAALIAGAAAHLFSKLDAKTSRIASLLAFTLIFGIFASHTWERSGFYRNPENLWRDNIAVVPQAHAPYNELGIFLIKKERYEEAIEVLRQCIAIDPTFDKAHNNLGTALSYLDRDEEGIAAFERALHYNSHDPDALGNLAVMYLRTDNAEKAVEYCRRTIEIRPMSPSAYFNMGLALQQLERNEEATATFQRAVAMNPTSSGFRRILGMHLYKVKKYKEALEQLLLALELGKPSIHTLNSAAWIMATNNDPALRDGPRALQMITMAIGIAPRKDIGLLKTYGAVLAELGRFEEAVQALREAILLLKENGGDPSAVETLESQLLVHQQRRPYREG